MMLMQGPIYVLALMRMLQTTSRIVGGWLVLLSGPREDGVRTPHRLARHSKAGKEESHRGLALSPAIDPLGFTEFI